MESSSTQQCFPTFKWRTFCCRRAITILLHEFNISVSALLIYWHSGSVFLFLFKNNVWRAISEEWFHVVHDKTRLLVDKIFVAFFSNLILLFWCAFPQVSIISIYLSLRLLQCISTNYILCPTFPKGLRYWYCSSPEKWNPLSLRSADANLFLYSARQPSQRL
jgi:hypothetical protein